MENFLHLPKFIEQIAYEGISPVDIGYSAVREGSRDDLVIDKTIFQLSLSAVRDGWIIYYMNIESGDWARVCRGEEFISGKTIKEATKEMRECLLTGDVI